MSDPILFEDMPGKVKPEWIDYNSHMTVPRYFDAMIDSINKWFELVDLGETYMASEGKSMFTAQSHWNYIRELKLDDPLKVTMQLLDADSNKIRYFAQLIHAEENYLAATAELLVIHVDMETRKVTKFSDEKLNQLRARRDKDAQAGLPPYAGGIIKR